jgi:amino acid transporter
MRMAVRTVFYRIIGIYMLAILIIGLNVSQKSPDLLSAVAGGGKTAASSPFVVICKQTGVKVLPSIINAVVMTSALSSCNENIYAVSRTLMALARNGEPPSLCHSQ